MTSVSRPNRSYEMRTDAGQPASGRRPFIIPVFLPHSGCPHQCVFCNQHAITGVQRKTISPAVVRSQISSFLKFRGKNRTRAEVAFFGGNFLGLNPDDVNARLSEAGAFLQAGTVDGIRFSTRPDTIDIERLDRIQPYGVSTVELGVQSMDDHILALALRGHTAADTEKAVDLLKQRNYRIGLQMMVGLPGDSAETALATAKKISALQPDFVRIYPTLVLENSLLAKWYQSGKYKPISLDECIDLVKNLYLYFKEKNIAVIRMGLQVSEDLEKETIILAGPYHPSFGHLVHSKVFLDLAVSVLASEIDLSESVTIKVHPRSIPKMRGFNNENISVLKKRFQLGCLNIASDPTLAEDQLSL